jgi:hypothetical protein
MINSKAWDDCKVNLFCLGDKVYLGWQNLVARISKIKIS